MHRIRLAVLLFLCVSAAGCQPVPGVLLDAEAIVMEHPDSAARLLEGVPAPEKRLSRRNYAHYALVLTQARWLAGENMIDDTLSDVALDYYRTHTDDFAAAHKAYYYAAKIANQRRQPEVAMTLLLKSRDMLPPKGEWRRRYVVETWLGVFCGQQHLFEEKIRHAQQAYAYADSMERYDWMCISLGDMAHAYMGLDNYDSMEYIRKNLSLNLSALKLGKLYNMSESTFARHFYKLCSQTPYEYIMNLRIEKSKQLLSDGKLTMSAIANECGFYDGAHFTRCFEKYTKKKPSEYKNIK